MKLRLFKGLDTDEISELKQNFIQAHYFRQRLIEVLETEVESLQASMRNEETFASPNWAYLQADRVAQTKAFKRVIGILEQKAD